MKALDEGIPLLLFVAGDVPRTTAAVENLRRALTEFQDRKFRLEIVNVFESADRAIAERVLVTPTLLAPGQSRRLVGDLSEESQLRYFLRTVEGR